MALLIFEGVRGQRDQVIRVPFGAKQSISSGNASAAFSGGTEVITIAATAAGNVSFGLAPSSADSSDFPLAAAEKASFEVVPGLKLFWQES